ncbi:NlpC/P60 family protein [Lysobacter sp. F6437]|uniref:NlpC/P60 family protein n=1 Tax=Lysobacter sp. F6437 TaxID=3459296 RepID=UPI00403D7A9A
MRLLGEPFTEAEVETVLATARSMLKWPWRHQGRTSRGIDCLGLVALSFSAVRRVVDREGYGRTPYNRQLRASLIEHFGPPIGRDDLRPGDVVTLRWTGEERHVAIVTDHPEGLGLIHCYDRAPGGAPGGRVIEHRLSPDYLSRIVEGFRG